jgi:hypothetical protein
MTTASNESQFLYHSRNKLTTACADVAPGISYIAQSGSDLIFTNECGVSSRGHLDSGRSIILDGNNKTAAVSEDNNKLLLTMELFGKGDSKIMRASRATGF